MKELLGQQKANAKKESMPTIPLEAKRLLEQLYGGPRAVPYIPHAIPS